MQTLREVSGEHQPEEGLKVGQLAGVAKGHDGSIWIFHRGERVWDGGSFRGSRAEEITYTEPIKQKTVHQLDQDTGIISCCTGYTLVHSSCVW